MSKLPESGMTYIPDPDRTFPIGAVSFKVKDDGIWADLMGPPRVEALQKLYRKQPVMDATLGELVPYVFGYGPITWDQVNWETAGVRVTAVLEGEDMSYNEAKKAANTKCRELGDKDLADLGQQTDGNYSHPDMAQVRKVWHATLFPKKEPAGQ